MSIPVPIEPESQTSASASAADTTPAVATTETGSPDPITGEPGAHPLGVGAGALAAGAAGAAIGAVLGPIGVLVGATVGAVVGGLAGHEAAASADTETPVSLDTPLPTASSGLITPEESSFLGDSTSADSGVTGEAPLVTESALPAAFATNAEPEKAPMTSHEFTPASTTTTEPETSASAVADMDTEEAAFDSNPVYQTHLSTEETIRTGAYYRYLGREETHAPGSAMEDWIAAEKEVLQS